MSLGAKAVSVGPAPTATPRMAGLERGLVCVPGRNVGQTGQRQEMTRCRQRRKSAELGVQDKERGPRVSLSGCLHIEIYGTNGVWGGPICGPFGAQRLVVLDGVAGWRRVGARRYPLTYSGVKTAWQRLRKRAGVKDFRFHDLRHDLATKLLRATGNLKLVQRALNHSDIRTTLRYAHVLDSEVTAVLEAVAEPRKLP